MIGGPGYEIVIEVFYMLQTCNIAFQFADAAMHANQSKEMSSQYQSNEFFDARNIVEVKNT